MFSILIMCFAAFIFFNKSDGRFHHRNKLVRRQNLQMPPPNMMQGPAYPAPLAHSPIPLAYGMPPSSAIPSSYPSPPYAFNPAAPLPPPYAANYPVSSGSAPGVPGQASYPGNNPNFGPNGQTINHTTVATFNPLSQNYNPNPLPLNKRANLFRKNAPENGYGMTNGENSRMSHFNPFRERMERRRKSVQGKMNNVEKGNKVHRNPKPASAKRKAKGALEKKGEMEKLLEEGEKILEMSTESKVIGGEAFSKSQDDFFEDDDEKNGNVTVIPIPKGIQLKTTSDKDNKHVEETVNITSSTQRTMSVGNNTEIENVMEMEMEKKIEDDKGDSRGSEQVKIVETERVKPIMISKGSSAHKHRKRRFHLRKLFKRHRSKRGTTNSAFLYSKMMKKFLSDLKRRDGAGRATGLSNRTEITATPGQSDAIRKATKTTDRVFKDETRISAKDRSVYDSNEMEEFLKHILTQLVKLRKAHDESKLRSKHSQYTDFSRKNSDLSFARRRKKHHSYPEHVKMVMNLNMTWDDKLRRHGLKPVNKPEWPEYIPVESELTNVVPSSTQRAFAILYLQDKKDTDSGLIITVLILCMMTLLLPLLLCILPRLYKTSKLKKECSALKNCPFCPRPVNNQGREGICRLHGENLASEECLQLEWQSDTGDWLSEKEIEFK